MNSLFLAVFCLAFSNIPFLQGTDLANEKLNGKIKTITSFRNDKVLKIVNYNEAGNIINYKSYDSPSGKIIGEYIKLFDNKNREIFYEDQSLTIIHKYNDTNNVIKKININKLTKDTIMLYHYQYNQNDLLIKYETFGFKTQTRMPNESTTYEYDSLNRLINENYELYGNKDVIYKPQRLNKKYRYDPLNGSIQKIVRNEKGEEFITNNFNQYNPAVLKKEINVERLVDENNNVMTKIRYKNTNKTDEIIEKGELIEKTEYFYDDYQNLVITKIWNAKKNTLDIFKNEITYY